MFRIRRLLSRLSRYIMGKTEGLPLKPGSNESNVEFFGEIIVNLVKKFWTLCTTTLLILLLLYWLYGSLVALLLLFFAIGGLLYNVQDRILYHPEQPPNARLFVESPSIYGLPYESVKRKTRDGVHIHLIFIKQAPNVIARVPTVIFFHGNAGNIGHRLLNTHALYLYCGFNILLVEYRGFGKSDGSPSEKGLYLDAETTMDYLLERPDIDKTQIIVLGRSLGGAVAIHLASQPYYERNIMCLLVENTFTTIPSIAKCLFTFKLLNYIPLWFYKNKFMSLERVKKVRIPMLFLSGQADTLVPPKMMQELYDFAGASLKRLARIEGGTHNETWQCPGYYETINRFLAEVRQVKVQKTSAQTKPETYSTNIPFDDHGLYDL